MSDDVIECWPVHASRGGMRGVVRCAHGPAATPGSGLAEDPVHFCAAGRAGALGHPAAVRLGGLTAEVAFFLAFHSVPVVALRHWWCLSIRGLPTPLGAHRTPGKRPPSVARWGRDGAS